MVFKIPSGNTGEYITKTVSADVTDYDELVFSIYSRNKRGNEFIKPADFYYKIDIYSGTGTVTEYYVPTVMNFSDVVIYISGMTTISRIRITALHDDEDYLIISNMLAVKDEIPLDIFTGVKEALEEDIVTAYGDGILIGTTTASAGVSSITVSSENFLERYATILIDDGTNSEVHTIGDTADGLHQFLSIYDGATLVNDYTAANVYLTFPVEIASNSRELLMPSISIWGITPEHIWRGAKLEDVNDTFITGGNVYIRRQGALFNHTIALTCVARHNEILAYLSEIARRFIAREKLYINGRRYEIKFNSIPTETEPVQNTDIFPQIVYLFDVEIREEIWTRVSSPPADAATVTYTIVSQGEI